GRWEAGGGGGARAVPSYDARDVGVQVAGPDRKPRAADCNFDAVLARIDAPRADQAIVVHVDREIEPPLVVIALGDKRQIIGAVPFPALAPPHEVRRVIGDDALDVLPVVEQSIDLNYVGLDRAARDVAGQGG